MPRAEPAPRAVNVEVRPAPEAPPSALLQVVARALRRLRDDAGRKESEK